MFSRDYETFWPRVTLTDMQEALGPLIPGATALGEHLHALLTERFHALRPYSVHNDGAGARRHNSSDTSGPRARQNSMEDVVFEDYDSTPAHNGSTGSLGPFVPCTGTRRPLKGLRCRMSPALVWHKRPACLPPPHATTASASSQPPAQGEHGRPFLFDHQPTFSAAWQKSL